MITLQQLDDAIDPATGTLRLSLPLASLPDNVGPPFAVAAVYASPAATDVSAWNLSAPTGVLGLGWNLALMRIVASDPADTVGASTSYYFENGGAVVPLVRLGTAVDGAQTYGRFDGAFWTIRFYPTAQRWVLIDENGTRYCFGHLGSTNAVETCVAWGNWLDASRAVNGQASVATAWRLAQIQDLWGNLTELDYTQSVSTVGAGADGYTQACYLRAVTGTSGGRLVFNYADKTADEYQSAHTTPAPPNAWQTVYETKYLQSIVAVAPGGATLQTIVFSYGLLSTGKTTKRLLAGVQIVPPAGRASPGVSFVYATSVSNTDPSYGQITQVTTPEGGVGLFSYASVSPAFSNRSTVLQAPSGSVSFANPTLNLGDDYAVTVWCATDNSQFAVTACTWAGRWVSTPLATLAANANSVLQSAVARDSFAVRVDAQLIPYRRDPTMAGAWAGPANAFPVALTGGEVAATACTDGAAAVLGLTSLQLTSAIWNGSAWTALAAQTLQGGGATPIAAFSANGVCMMAAVTDGANASAPVAIYRMATDSMRQWWSRSVSLVRPSASIDSLSIQVGSTFAVVRSSGSAGALRNVTFDLVDWSTGNASTQRLTQLLVANAATLPTAVIHGSSIAIGELLFRYNGVYWGTQDVEGTMPAGAASLAAQSFGTDTLLRTFVAAAGGSILDVVSYDPNATDSSAAWSSVLSGTLPATGYVAHAAVTRNEASAFIVFARPAGQGGNAIPANALYYRMPNAQWSHAFDIPETLTASECASLQVVGECFIVYQSGTNVIAYPLVSGTVNVAGRTVLASQALLVPNGDPTALLARRLFATYSGTWNQNPTLSLHAVTSSGADGLQPLGVVSRMRRLSGNTIDATTGYPAVDATPTYETGSAVAHSAGAFARFNRTSLAVTSVATGAGSGSVLAEIFNGLTTTEAASLASALRPNYPTGAMTNAGQFTRALTGTPYRSTQFWTDATGTAQSNVQTTWLNVTVRHFLAAGSAAGDPVGFCAGATQSQTVTDGVTTLVTTTFNANLLPQVVSSTRFDGNGNLETLTTTYSYFPDQYAASGPENLLTPVIQTLNATNNIVVQAQVTTWSSAWGASLAAWAPRGSYVANAANFSPFNAWSGGATPAGWLNCETITARNSNGVAVTTVDALGRTTFNLFDANDARLVARFRNAAASEAAYYGFESYERNPSWSYLGSSSIQSHIVASQYHTGSRSLQIEPSGSAPTGPVANFLQTTSGDSYLFSCWMLVPPGFVPDATKALWSLQVYTVAATPQAVGNPVVLAFPAASAQWQYLQAVVNLAAIRQGAGIPANTPVSLTILGCDNRASSVAVYADELCFSPLDADFDATVFDAASGRVMATLEANGATWRPVHDGGQRVGALVGPSERDIAWISLLAYARLMSPDGTYQAAFPNQALSVGSASFGIYQDFDASDASQWTLPANWSIAGNQLVFDGMSADPIGSRAELAAFSQSNYAALVRVPAASASATVSIGTGDVFVSWVPAGANGSWILQQQVSGAWTSIASLPGTFAEQWLFAIVDNVAFFFADGAQVLGWRIGTPTLGKLQLAATAAAAFERLVVAVDPSLAVTFIDGGGVTLATMAMVDNQTMQVTGQLFDPLGRPAYERNPVRQSVALGVPAQSGGTTSPNSGLNEGALTTYLPYLSGGTQQMTIAQYTNPAISDAPYTQKVFEASPLGRVIEVGAPGAGFTIGSGHTTRTAYGTNVAGSWLTRVLQANAPGLAAGSYYRTAITSPDGHLIESITNQAGQIIARALTPAGASAPLSIESFLYDGAGRQVTHRQPNFYFPPANGTAATWQLTASYDFTGNLTASTDPDGGTTNFLSDSIGRPRFSMDAAAAGLTPPVIRYVRYDALDRVIERGTVSAASLTWSGLAAHVDDASWPAAADGAIWARRYVYDRPDRAGAYDPQPRNLVGRLAQVEINSTGTANPATAAVDLYAYAYDLKGNVIQQNSYVPAFDTTTRQSQFAWDNIARPIEIGYPRPLDPISHQPVGAATRVTYFYDRLGRVAGIGTAPEGTEVLDPSNPNPGPMARYAWYRYDARGLLQNVTYGLNSGGPLVQSAQYDAAGRTLSLSGDYFSQSLTYGAGGLASSTNWSGRATGATTRYAARPGPVDDPASGMLGARTWLYRYDAAGRLNGAVASDATTDSSLAAGTASAPITFDANGALLTVPRSPALETYGYSTGARINSSTQQISVDVSVSLDFSTALPAGCTFGASNLGPSTSQIVTTGADAPYFQLGGGSLGHFEYFQLLGVLGQSETYTLQVTWRAPAPFAGQAGAASCDLLLMQAQGLPYRVQLQDLSAGAGAWQTATLTIDMAVAMAAAGFAGAITSVGVQIWNAKRDASGVSGAPLQIKSLTLVRAASSPTPASYQYDAAGRMIQSPPRMITSIGYDRMSGRLAQLTFASGQPVTSVALTRGPGSVVATRTLTYADNTTLKTLEVRAPDGGILAVETLDASGNPTKTLYLRDPQKTFGVLPQAAGDPELYQIRDRLGSLRAVAAAGTGPSAGLRQRIDYGPFGQQILCAGTSPSAERFTGQPWDAVSGLSDYAARLYDPQLRNFLQPDAAHETPNGYAYAGGDPVNFTDPSGNFVEELKWVGWGGYQGYRGYGLYQSGYISYAWENPGEFALDVAEVAAASAASAVLLMALSPVLGPMLGGYTFAVHSMLFIPYSVPVVSLTLGWLSGMYSAAMSGVVRTASHYFIRGRRESLSAGDLADAFVTHGWAARYTSGFDTFYSHFLAPRLWFPYKDGTGWHAIRGRKGGWKLMETKGAPGVAAVPIFQLSDGTFAFEEFAAGGGYVLPFLQGGNKFMKLDTNLALAWSNPVNYFFRRWKYGSAAYKASGLVLEHRVQAGYYLFIPHAVHTPGKGGRFHIGISTFIENGVMVEWLLLNNLARGVDTLRSRAWLNEALIAEEGVGDEGDFEELS
jgi:RHS repeat-associated protein